MKCKISHIGVIDHAKQLHSVHLKSGLNIITGKSSTGKSALIEIFDYCFGSADFTIPYGVITEVADIYFVIFKFPDTDLVIARKPDAQHAFIKEIKNVEIRDGLPKFPENFFDEKFYLTLANFKKELAGYFKLDINDVDTDREKIQYRGKKSPAPSIRSFTSYMLQHQNLVANKHAVFYRFDEKEKREQAIEHIKIFLGFVDQQYFVLSQNLNNLMSELRRIEFSLPKKQEKQKLFAQELKSYLDQYASITGLPLINQTPESLLNNPARWLNTIQSLEIAYDSSSDENHSQLINLEKQRAEIIIELRHFERKKREIVSSIEYAESYSRDLKSLEYPEKAQETVTNCPFCEQETNEIEKELDKLSEAVDWLNSQLSNSSYLKPSYQSDKKKIYDKIDQKKLEIINVEKQIQNIKNNIDEIDKKSSLYEVALRIKLKIENFLEDLSNNEISELEMKISDLQDQIAINKSSIQKYKLKEKLTEVEKLISDTMNDIGNKLSFEESFKPLNLKFSFETFDLWNEKEKGKKVFLRSMGSGANWLYCHLVLFMSLHKLFCQINDCKIPPILFLDQPTQVYFPNTSLDTNEEFDPEALAPSEKTQSVDDDISSVNRFFSEIIDFCDTTKKETGSMPQIIITDHADDLKLENNKVFNSFVRARWRTRGFIHPIPG